MRHTCAYLLNQCSMRLDQARLRKGGKGPCGCPFLFRVGPADYHRIAWKSGQGQRKSCQPFLVFSIDAGIFCVCNFGLFPEVSILAMQINKSSAYSSLAQMSFLSRKLCLSMLIFFFWDILNCFSVQSVAVECCL